MGKPGAGEVVELLSRREDYVAELSSGPTHKRDLVGAIGDSRSTVDRAIDELESVGFVERRTRGYVATTAGRLALERYRAALDEQEAILAARDVLAAVPPSLDVPIELFEDATIDRFDSTYEVFDVFYERVQAADLYLVLTPEVVDSRDVRLCHAGVLAGELEMSVITEEPEIRRLGHEFPEIMSDMANADGFAIYEGDPPPFSLAIATEDSGETTAALIVYEEDETVILRSDSPVATSWARSYFESKRGSASDETATVLGDAESSPLG